MKPNPHLTIRANAEFNSDAGTKFDIAYFLKFNLLSPQTNQNKFLFTFTFITMELDNKDVLLLVSILVLKRRIRRRFLSKLKEKLSLLVEGIFKNRELYGDCRILLQNMMLAD